VGKAKCKIQTGGRYLERSRVRVCPTPSPFGFDREKQWVIEAHNLHVRWSRGRKDGGHNLREFKVEAMRGDGTRCWQDKSESLSDLGVCY
jgi:hypothetical protein